MVAEYRRATLAKVVAMSRRSTPERLDAARRDSAGSPISNGEMTDRAEAALSAWERQAIAIGRARDGGFWEAGYRWIREGQGDPPSPPV